MPANTRKLMAWDSVVVIDCLEKRVGRYEFISPLIKEAEAKELTVVVSTMAQTETQRFAGSQPEDEIRIIDEFFDREWVHPEDMGSAIAKIARDICIKHKIEHRDAVHIATAKFRHCPIFLTNDGMAKKKRAPLLPLDGKILLSDGTPLRIMTPQQYMEMTPLEGKPLFANTTAVSPSEAEDISDATPERQTKEEARPKTADAHGQGRLDQSHQEGTQQT